MKAMEREREAMVRQVEEYRKYRSAFAYPHVFSPYNIGWRYPADKNLEVQRLEVEELDLKNAA